MASVRSNVPNPCSPDPALFETAIRLLMSFLFARAPMRVSGVPQSPNPMKGVTCNIREYMQDPVGRTSAQQCIPRFDILDGLINRIPNFAFAGYRSTRRGIQKPKCLRRPGHLHLRLVRPRDARTVRNGGRMSGYGLEEHFLRSSDRYGSSSKGGVQSAYIECSTDHGHGPARSKKSDEIIVMGVC